MTVKRIRFLQALLDFIGLGGRLHLEWISSAEAQKFVKVATDFTDKIRELGPNPLNGFDEKIRSMGLKALEGLNQPSETLPVFEGRQQAKEA